MLPLETSPKGFIWLCRIAGREEDAEAVGSNYLVQVRGLARKSRRVLGRKSFQLSIILPTRDGKFPRERRRDARVVAREKSRPGQFSLSANGIRRWRQLSLFCSPRFTCQRSRRVPNRILNVTNKFALLSSHLPSLQRTSAEEQEPERPRLMFLQPSVRLWFLFAKC